MTKSLIFFIGLIFGIVILGLAVRKSSVFILAIPLMVYLVSAIYHRPEDIQFAVSREIFPDHAPQGTPITVKLTVTNQSQAIDELVIKESLPNGIQRIDGKASIVTLLPPQARIELEYSIKAHRGQYDIYEMTACARDFGGFFELLSTYRSDPHLVIHPRYPKLDRIKVHPPQTRGFAGPISARQGGTGIDFYGIREYQSGDPERQINWKMAGRNDQELFTNIFEQERVADVGLILDARQRMNVSSPYDSLFEYSVRATAALAENFLADGNRVSLLVYGSCIERVFPGYGRIQKDRILKALARTRPGLNYALASLAYLPTRFFPAKSQTVIISPLSPEDIPVIVQMRARGYAVMVISPDPVSFASAIYHDSASQIYRIAHAERDFMLQQVRRSGVPAVNWRVDQPLEVAVRNTLSRHSEVFHRNGVWT